MSAGDQWAVINFYTCFYNLNGLLLLLPLWFVSSAKCFVGLRVQKEITQSEDPTQKRYPNQQIMQIMAHEKARQHDSPKDHTPTTGPKETEETHAPDKDSKWILMKMTNDPKRIQINR